jgi:hypothetical protein
MSEDVHGPIPKFRFGWLMSRRKQLHAVIGKRIGRADWRARLATSRLHAFASAGAPAGSIVSIEVSGLILNQAT